MKKIFLTFIGLAFIGCEKTEIIEKKNCNCGLITADNVHDYSIDIRNSCSNNVKTFYLTEGDWMNAHPGDNFCISNVSNW